MKTFLPKKTEYDEILRYVATHDIELLVLDFNGVLDDYYMQKIIFLRHTLGTEYEHYLPELLLAIERAYIADRSATIEQSFERFFDTLGIPVTDEQRDKLTHHMFASRLTDDARVFLDSLEVPFIIYTALSQEQAEHALGVTQYNLFTRDRYQEAKPSIANLKEIMKQFDVPPHKVCVVGDGLVDDLMPASLIGAHTILISPYAEVLLHPSAG